MLKDKYLSRNQKIIPKKYNKHVIFQNNGQTRPWELCRIGQICTIFKIQLFLDPFKTKNSLQIKRLQLISVLKHVILPRKGPKSSQILNIVPFWPILLNCEDSLGLCFGNLPCLRTLFGWF